ncbi:hypothetical protein [Hugenholtzia roseola]|uniref:hypothetical protein n=1 Tax=Hugenholtzia roseola TaxID=1002 RepID=UPI0012B64367|nr:hypothetical protein [Hugenholtzia roseola]
MLTDTWVIAQLLGQFCLLLLASVALFWSVRLVFSWQQGSTSPLQIALEKRTYLVSAILEMLMLLQMLLVVIYLVTLNEHLPALLKGAMCAEGSLAANDYGKPAFILKISSFIGSLFFYLLNHLDQKDPASALTPRKYWVLFMILPLLFLDFTTTFLYYANIDPQVITTCCSVNLFEKRLNPHQFLEASALTEKAVWTFYALILLQTFLVLLLKKIIKKKGFILFWLLLLVVYTFVGVHSLENHFVKYIYGLPSHLCLYDTFLGHYHYVGYALTSGYLMLWVSLLWLFLVCFFGKKIGYQIPYRKLQFWLLWGLLLSGVLPSLYEWFWEGKL